MANSGPSAIAYCEALHEITPPPPHIDHHTVAIHKTTKGQPQCGQI